MNARHWFFRLWWLTLLIKIVIGSVVPLASDEAYYWIWSNHLQWSYFDHPPGVAVLMWLGHPLENWGSAVRIPGILLGHCSLLIWWQLLKNKLDDQALKLWFALSVLTPFIGFGSLVLTPDLPLTFFWPLGLLAFERCLADKKASGQALLNYAGLGLALGLGFCSKYPIVLMIPVFLIHLARQQSWKKVWVPGILITFVFGLLASFPVLYWNATHDWQSFKFQLHHGLGENAFRLETPITYILGQILLFNPLLLPALWRGFRKPGLRLMSESSGFTWFFFLYSSLKAAVEANWPITAYASGFALVAAGSKNARAVIATCVFSVFACLLLASHMIHPWIPGLPRNLNESGQYRDLAYLTQQYDPLFAGSYQMASVLSFQTKKPIYKLAQMSRYDFFDELPESRPTSQNFYLLRHVGEALPKWVSERQNHVETVKTFESDFELLRIEFL